MSASPLPKDTTPTRGSPSLIDPPFRPTAVSVGEVRTHVPRSCHFDDCEYRDEFRICGGRRLQPWVWGASPEDRGPVTVHGPYRRHDTLLCHDKGPATGDLGCLLDTTPHTKGVWEVALSTLECYPSRQTTFEKGRTVGGHDSLVSGSVFRVMFHWSCPWSVVTKRRADPE